MNLTEAAAQAKRWGEFVRAFQHIDEAAEAILAFEQTRHERQAEIEKLATQLGERREQLSAVQTEIALAEAQVSDLRESAKTKAAAMIDEARTQAERILTDARAEVATLKQEADELSGSLSGLRSQVNHSQSELKTLTDRVDAAKAKMRALLEA